MPNDSRMSLFDLLLFLHIVAAMLWIGGAATGTLIGSVLRRSDSAAPMASYCAAFATVAGPLFGGSGMLVLLSGIGMMMTDAGPDWTALWVILGLIGWLVSMVMGATVVGMSWFRIGQQLAEPDASIAAMQPAISRAVSLTWIDLAIRTAVVVLMVWRPT